MCHRSERFDQNVFQEAWHALKGKDEVRTIFQHCPEWLTCLSKNISAHHSRNTLWQSHLYIFNVNRRQFTFHPAYQSELSDGYLPGLCWKHINPLLVLIYSCINLIRSDLFFYLYIFGLFTLLNFYQEVLFEGSDFEWICMFSSCTTEFVITFLCLFELI